MNYVGKRLENGPPQLMRLFHTLFQVCYIKRTTYKNLDLFYIKNRKPFANRLENTLSVANPYWMIEWRTPCTYAAQRMVTRSNFYIKNSGI